MPASTDSQGLSATGVRDGIAAAFGRTFDADQPVLDALCWARAKEIGRSDDLTDPQERRAQAGDAFLAWAQEQVAAYNAAGGV